MLEYGSSIYVFMVILLKLNKKMTVWGTRGLLQTDSFVTLTQ